MYLDCSVTYVPGPYPGSAQHRGSAAKRDSMKKRPPETPTYKISALRQLHPLVRRRRPLTSLSASSTLGATSTAASSRQATAVPIHPREGSARDCPPRGPAVANWGLSC